MDKKLAKKRNTDNSLSNQYRKNMPEEVGNSQRPQRDSKGLFLPGNSVAQKWTEEKAMAIGQELLDWLHASPMNFLFKDFLFEKGLYSDALIYLEKTFPRFSVYIARAREIEALRIQKYALFNKLNPGMAQWVLAVHHNQSPVQKTEITGKDGAPLSPPSITIQPVAVKGSKEPQQET